MNYTNVIGYFIFILFLLQFISGIGLAFYYSPFIAFSSVYYIMIDINIGWIIRFFHVLGSSLFMFFLLFHLIRAEWIKSNFYFIIFMIFYLNNSNNNGFWYIVNMVWISGWILYFLSLATGFLGYILNWGQMSYRGITVMINMISVIPFIPYSIIRDYLWCSSLVIVNRVFNFHFIIGFIIGNFIIIHIILLHWVGGSNPTINSSSINIPFYIIFFKDCFIGFSLTLCFSLLFFLDIDIFGNCDNLIIANPLSTPNHIIPEWYFLIYYAILRSLPNKLFGVLIVLVLFILLN